MYSKEDTKRLKDAVKKLELETFAFEGYGKDPQKAVNKMREDISNLIGNVKKRIFPNLKSWHVWVGMISISMILSSLGFNHEMHGNGVGNLIILSFIGGFCILHHNKKQNKKLEEINRLHDLIKDTKEKFDVK